MTWSKVTNTLSEKEDDGGRDRRSMKESCAVKTVGKTPKRLSEEFERKMTDPLQVPSTYQSDGIEDDDLEVQESSSSSQMRSRFKDAYCQIDQSDLFKGHIQL